MPKVKITYKPEPSDPSPLPVEHTFKEMSAVMDFIKRQKKNSLVEDAVLCAE